MISSDDCPLCNEEPLESTLKGEKINWLQCGVCDQWYHTICLKLSINDVNSLQSYHCKKCEKQHGPSVYRRKSKRAKIQIDYVALNDGDIFAVDKTVHPHVDRFLNFSPTANDLDFKMNPYIYVERELTKCMALSTRLTKPILVATPDSNDVGMKLPMDRSRISVDYITEKVGDDLNVEVMDVLSQQGVSPSWRMGMWRDYFYTEAEDRDRIRNVISLEISDIEELGDGFIRPQMVRDLDLVDKVWCDNSVSRPKVTKYCLMSVKGAFTDFHIDFGGTSVYYTVCSGSKIFLMFPPTDDNLGLYTSWCLEQNQNFMWFPEYSKSTKHAKIKPSGGFKVVLNPGDVFIIPSGWIHAVYTPDDSVVIGGNFLTLMDIPVELKINQIEKETRVPSKFRFPYFNKCLWFAGWFYLNNEDEFIKDVGDNNEKLSNRKAYDILKLLLDHLKNHLMLSKTSGVAKKSIPTDLIGKDVEGFLIKLERWMNNFSYNEHPNEDQSEN